MGIEERESMDTQKQTILKSSIFGEKLAYYNSTGTAISFPDSLYVNPGDFSLSPQGITSFLSFRHPIGDWTMFNEIKKVPCGAEVKDGKQRYYWYPRFGRASVSLEEALDTIESLLLKAIKKIADNKAIAIPLSGGVDSSMVVALCRKLYPDRKIGTYSAGFYGDDEFEYARLVAKLFKTAHKERVLGREDYIGKNSLLKPLIRLKGAPLHPNEIALAAVEVMAKEDGYEIAICGEGSDDIFGGYGQNLRMYLNYDGRKPFFEYFLDNYRYIEKSVRSKMVREDYLCDDYKLLMKAMVDEEIPSDIENKVFYFIQKIHTPGLIIRGINAMNFAGLEPGFPYANNELVDFVNSLPFDYKVRWKSAEHKKMADGMYFRDITEKLDTPKFILKKLAEKYLPSQVIYRTKHGFPVPFDKWLGDIKVWPLNQEVFLSNDISSLKGWEKFMLINLNAFTEVFSG